MSYQDKVLQIKQVVFRYLSLFVRQFALMEKQYFS